VGGAGRRVPTWWAVEAGEGRAGETALTRTEIALAGGLPHYWQWALTTLSLEGPAVAGALAAVGSSAGSDRIATGVLPLSGRTCKPQEDACACACAGAGGASAAGAGKAPRR
jgi:hypothetical protein